MPAKKDAATEKANREKNNELNEEARHISSEIGAKVTVDRAQEVSKSNVAVYNELSERLACCDEESGTAAQNHDSR